MVGRAAILFTIFTLAGAAAACGRTARRAADCSRAAGDSARAVCVALDTLARGARLPSRVFRVEHTADGFRVVTVPANPHTLDGMGVVDVTRAGRVTSVVVTDSA
ncbi:hypothetical protein J421_5341 (plasmid) [Gemmatirosa kalamazoonensis]|uniref:Uncharacterized protein n=1 Tax=Gemmatirosa kalamazoonensis TaxID=861299 RepID=W0RQ88_9BACT|nr:hypothetical protein [Gemmatirosa kalamazoonensis]AHG92876.1 hypothetical protein J421_5341 [Gemmatirosa kalamazoonensis]